MTASVVAMWGSSFPRRPSWLGLGGSRANSNVSAGGSTVCHWQQQERDVTLRFGFTRVKDKGITLSCGHQACKGAGLI